MFTQRISMDCTKEQYEKYLKDELLKMGYEERTGYWEQNDVISNNHNSEHGVIGNTYSNNQNTANRTYLGSFNAPLFLALAAMTDNPKVLGYGEYITDEKYLNVIRRNGFGEQPFDFFGYHKSTKEEIIDWFKTDVHDLSKSPIYLHRNQNDFREIKLSDEQIEKVDDAIKLLKSLGFKVMRKTEIWEEV